MKTIRITKFIGTTGFSVVIAVLCAPALQAQDSSTTVIVPGAPPPPPQPPPTVVVQTPPPAPAPEQPGVPDAYVWDGHEYVGLVGDIYYYLGPDNVWVPADKEVLKHFRHWEKHHKDWREHAVRNQLYHRAAPRHEYPPQPTEPPSDDDR
ncbi:MAG TPA: hypothetical protein VF988_00910 [Verrucomicrobiae bacterium]